MTTLLHVVRYALRVLARHRAFTGAAIATLAVAIGPNTAIFALVSGVLLRPLPFPQPEQLVRVEEQHQGRRLNLTGATFADVRERVRGFSGVAAYRLTTPGLSAGTMPRQVRAAEVTPDYFVVFGVGPRAGRVFGPPDFAAGARPTAVVSSGIWQGLLGGEPAAVGRQVIVNAIPTEIVGVMPEGFEPPGTPDIWVPSATHSPLLRNRRAHLFTVVARVAPDATFADAAGQLSAAAATIDRDSGGIDGPLTLQATSLQQRITEPVRQALLLIWAAVGLVLMIASANVATLLLMHGSARARELAIRTAIGAPRMRLVRQLATESLVLGLAGGTVGVAFGAAAVPLLRSALPAGLPRAASVSVDAAVIWFAVVLSVLTAVVFGMLPAFRTASARAVDGLRERASTGGSGSLARTTLVGAEVALTVMLLAGAALLARSFLTVTRVSPGFDPANTLAIDVALPTARYPDAAAVARFHGALTDALSGNAGVTAVGVTGALPMSGTPATTMVPDGTRATDSLSADVISATPGYFAAVRVPLRAGRLFEPTDIGGAAPVAIVSEAAARGFWPDLASPIGRTITMMDWGNPYQAQVVGVVGDVRQRGLDTDVQPAVYYPLAQFPETTLTQSIVLRTTGNPRAFIEAARAQVAAIDPDQPLAAIRTLDDVLSASVAQRRFNAMLLVAFAAAAVLLAAVGIYGVVAFAVAQRTREIGVRVALGAAAADVARFTLRHGAIPVLAGIAVGTAGALAGARAMRALLFGVGPADPAALAGAVVCVLLVAAAACAVPARRALSVDPSIVLRGDV